MLEGQSIAVVVPAHNEEELITATLDFASIAEWYDVLPWREWRTGPQLPVSRVIADELTKLAGPSLS